MSQPIGLPRVPRVDASNVAAVEHVLWLRGEQCLVRSVVRQAWSAAAGDPRDIVIGVAIRTAGDPDVHAWLEGDDDGHEFREITRIHPALSR